MRHGSHRPVMKLMMTINNCSVAADSYIRHLGMLFLADYWLYMVAPVALCAVLAIWIDVRFIIIALMLLLMEIPMLLALLYFYYGLSPEARWSIMEKEVTIDSQGIDLSFVDERMKKHVIRWDDVRYIIEKDDVLMLMLNGRRYTCLMLPTSAVNPDVAQALRQFVSQVH